MALLIPLVSFGRTSLIRLSSTGESAAVANGAPTATIVPMPRSRLPPVAAFARTTPRTIEALAPNCDAKAEREAK